MVAEAYKKLLEPLRIKNTVFRNRMFAGPTSVPTMDKWGHFTSQNIAYFEEKAKGGFALVTLGECVIYSKDGKTHDPQLALDDPTSVPCLVEMAEAIHSHGAVASIEITHGGAMSKPAFNNGKLPLGPSPMINKQGVQVEELTVDKIREIAEAFGEAAYFAKRCGFDMCTIHGGHGWLLSEFLSPIFNHRTDEFGGSVENRTRFPLMVIDEIRKKAGKDFLIEYRFSGDEFYDGGYSIEEGIEIAKALDGKVDLFNVSAGIHFLEPTIVKMHPSIFHSHGENASLAKAIREKVNTPVVTVGGYSEPDKMEKILEDGVADAICMGRQSLADPHFPEKVLEGRTEDITPCLRCLECMGASLGFGPVELHCSVNPILGREFKERMRTPSDSKKKVLVAGGGPGGMMAAITAAKRGHDVILCEASDKLGGALNMAEYVDFKEALLRLRDHLALQMEKYGVEVRMNCKVDENIVSSVDPDYLIGAVGAEDIVPPIKGIDLPNVLIGGIEAEKEELGNRVTIIGGGLVGCELAISLKRRGHEVTLIEMESEVARDAKIFHRVALMDQLKDVNIVTGIKCEEITEKGASGIGPNGEKVLFESDNVVIVCGMRPMIEESEKLRKMVKRYRPIANCCHPGKIMDAIRAGYDAGMDI